MRYSYLGRFVLCPIFLMLGVWALAAPADSRYHLLKKISLGAAPGGGEYFGRQGHDLRQYPRHQ
jgi:hypothetical protein